MTTSHDVHVQAVLSVGVIIYFQGTSKNYIFALSPPALRASPPLPEGASIASLFEEKQSSGLFLGARRASEGVFRGSLKKFVTFFRLAHIYGRKEKQKGDDADGQNRNAALG